jgi:hypothetical protein
MSARNLKRTAVAAAIASISIAACGGHPNTRLRTPTARLSTPTATRSQGTARPSQATVTVIPGAETLTVPRSYFGLSTEYWAMPLFERYNSMFERVLSLLRAPGEGPLILRIGGDSADHSILNPDVRRLPNAVFELTPAWFRQTSKVVRDVDARVILDLNLVVDLPSMAAEWARAAETQLPPGSIVGYEIGNEPDIYNPWYWAEIFSSIANALDIRLPMTALTPAEYTQIFESYAAMLAKFVPGVPLLGPVVAYPTWHLNWIRTFLAGPHPGLKVVTAHMYPYSACAPPGSAGYPTIGRLLSENATAGMARSLIPAVRLAHTAGLPFRLTEMNSVTCGGVAGVSDTFATALWAPDALFELLRAGVDGVHIHVRAYAVNAAFSVGAHGIVPHPLLYGLALFTRMLGPDAQLLQLRIRAREPVRMKVWAVRVGGDVLNTLLINKSGRSVRVNLRIPVRGRGTVQRLLAPSPAAKSGVTLDGQHLGARDTWQGRLVIDTIAPGRDGYELTVPAFSAALVTFHLKSH